MRKAAAAAKVSPAPSPQPPGTEGPFSAEILRQPRAPSSAPIRKDSPIPRNETSASMRGTPRLPPTRTSSTSTAFLTTRNLGGGTKASGKPSADIDRRRLTSLPMTTDVGDPDDRDDHEPDPQSPGPAESSSAASSSPTSSPAQSRIIRRPPRFQGNEGPSFADDDDDDDDVELAFLPYRAQAGASTGGRHDLSATLRGNIRDPEKRSSKASGRDRIHHSQTSDSSNSSVPTSRRAVDKHPSGPLSPRRTMELAGRSPVGKSKGYSRDSDGTPSMGSSFSDLDGTAVKFNFKNMLGLIS
jgi:hypothetical protein